MPTIVKTSKEADLRSLLGGFGNHLARWERLQRQWPQDAAIVLAYPNRILSQASIEWLVEGVGDLTPVSTFSGNERVSIEQTFLAAREGLAGHFEEDVIESLLPVTGIGVNTWSSVLRGDKGGKFVFVVAEWGCSSAEVGPAGPAGPIGGQGASRNRAALEVLSGDRPFGPTRWTVWSPDEALVEAGSDGLVDLGELPEGQKIVVRQEGLAFDAENKQYFEMGAEATTFKVQALRQATVVLLHPKLDDRPDSMSKLEIVHNGTIRPFELRSDARTEDGPHLPGDQWGLKDADGKWLAQEQLQDGANTVDLNPKEPITPPPTDSDDRDDADDPVPILIRFRLEDGLRRPLKEQPFTLDFEGETQSLFLETDDRGFAEGVWPHGESTATATTELRDIKRSLEIEHTSDTELHTLRFSRQFPRWIWWSLGAAIAIIFLMQWPIPYEPEIRIIDAESNESIAGAMVVYSNLDDDADLDVLSDSVGIVNLIMGKRPLYQALFQINPPTPIAAYAPNYVPERSTLFERTWYTTQEWPLNPLKNGEVAFETVNGAQKGRPLGQVRVQAQAVMGPKTKSVEAMSGPDGIVVLELDRRFEYEVRATRPSFSSDSAFGMAAHLKIEPNNVLELWPLLPCDGEKDTQGAQGKEDRFDLKMADVDFCFTCWNNNEYDRVEVLDGKGEVLWALEENAQIPGGGLGVDLQSNQVITKTVMIHSPTRYVAVRVSGTSMWGYQMNCPGSSCVTGLGKRPPGFVP